MANEFLSPVGTATDVQDGSLYIVRTQDVEPILERAKSLHNQGLDTTPMGDKLAAEFPFVIVEAYCNRMGITFSDFMRDGAHVKAMLNDTSLSGFRVWKGRV